VAGREIKLRDMNGLSALAESGKIVDL
jgi:hypothetical protein